MAGRKRRHKTQKRLTPIDSHRERRCDIGKQGQGQDLQHPRVPFVTHQDLKGHDNDQKTGRIGETQAAE